MRIQAVTTRNIGGLPDGRVELPKGSLVALAGANGTGKSKLLACILSPWTYQTPSSRTGSASEVHVEFRLTNAEREAIRQFNQSVGWPEHAVPERVSVGILSDPIIGTRRVTDPSLPALDALWNSSGFLAATPSMNIVYLPAERRLLEPNQQGIDLNQLSEMMAFQKNADSRNSVNNYGRLDDREFEDFAKALCVAATLPSESSEEDGSDSIALSRMDWAAFQKTVNALIAPKELLGLTRSHPDQLRVRTASGDIHTVHDLSSGERQALIIMSRVLRSGTRMPLVMIDEPDAYLHPHLSRRLVVALEEGVGKDGQLIVATHSPAILDGIPPSAIIRLEHGAPPRAIADETDRLELYRAAGFRSSALTQSDLLLITEGESDVSLLTLAIPQLGRASIRAAGGKAQVLRQVEQLKPFDLPVLGIVDLDVNRISISNNVVKDIFVWPTADIEGMYLSDRSALQTMLDQGLIKGKFSSVEELVDLIERLCMNLRENTIAEIAREQAVAMSSYEWPSPRGENPIERLRAAVSAATPIAMESLDLAIEMAEQKWDELRSNPLKIVRGKYVLSGFVTEASNMKTGQSLLEATARNRPPIAALESLALLINDRLQVDS